MSSYKEHFKKIKKNSEPPRASLPLSSTTLGKKNNLNKKNKKKFPLKAILVSAIGGAGCLMALVLDSEDLTGTWSKLPAIELSLFSSVRAEEKSEVNKAEKTGASEVEKEPRISDSNELPSKESEKATQAASDANSIEASKDLSHLGNLIKRSRELDQREESLNKLEAEIIQRQKDIEARIVQLDGVRQDIEKKLQDRIQLDEKRVDQLVEVYATMRPNQAAKIFEDLEESLAVQVLGKMKKKNAADILNVMNAEKAKRFTEIYSGFRSPSSQGEKP